jgi:hypothetical protein
MTMVKGSVFHSHRRTQTHTDAHRRTQTHTDAHRRTQTHTHARTHTHTHKQTNKFTRTCGQACLGMHTCMPLHSHAPHAHNIQWAAGSSCSCRATSACRPATAALLEPHRGTQPPAVGVSAEPDSEGFYTYSRPEGKSGEGPGAARASRGNPAREALADGASGLRRAHLWPAAAAVPCGGVRTPRHQPHDVRTAQDGTQKQRRIQQFGSARARPAAPPRDMCARPPPLDTSSFLQAVMALVSTVAGPLIMQGKGRGPLPNRAGLLSSC